MMPKAVEKKYFVHTTGRRLLGRILLDGEFISPQDLDAALAEQKQSNERLGEVLVRMGALERKDLDVVLAVQADLSSKKDAKNIAAGVRQLLGELLLQARIITPLQLDSVLKEQQQTGEKLGAILVRFGFLTPEELETLLAFQQHQEGGAAGSRRLRLGELLVASRQITREQLEDVLARQKLTKKKIGELLVEAGYVERQQIDYGIQLQRKLVTAALIAALSFVSLQGAPAAHAATNASGKLNVSARVLARASLTVVSQPRELHITDTDIERGYIDVNEPSRIEIRSNSPNGYLLSFESRGLSLKEIHVRGFGQDVQIAPGGGWISRPDSGRGAIQEELSYRFVLSESVRPGSYAWPLSMSLMAR